MECCVGLNVHSEPSVFVIQDGRGQVMVAHRLWYRSQHVTRGGQVPSPGRALIPPSVRARRLLDRRSRRCRISNRRPFGRPTRHGDPGRHGE